MIWCIEPPRDRCGRCCRRIECPRKKVAPGLYNSCGFIGEFIFRTSHRHSSPLRGSRDMLCFNRSSMSISFHRRSYGVLSRRFGNDDFARVMGKIQRDASRRVARGCEWTCASNEPSERSPPS